MSEAVSETAFSFIAAPAIKPRVFRPRLSYVCTKSVCQAEGVCPRLFASAFLLRSSDTANGRSAIGAFSLHDRFAVFGKALNGVTHDLLFFALHTIGFNCHRANLSFCLCFPEKQRVDHGKSDGYCAHVLCALRCKIILISRANNRALKRMAK